MELQQDINPMDTTSTVNQTDHFVIELPIELTNITGTKLQHLNGDCLLQIFSCPSLTWKDLYSLAETYPRFLPITQRLFPKDFSIETCSYGHIKYKFMWNNHVEWIENGLDIAQIVKMFGSGLSALMIRRHDPEVVHSIAEHCDEGKLKRLEFYYTNVTQSDAVAFQPIFQQLQSLHLHWARIECSNNVFANCHMLTELEMFSTSDSSAIFENTFPNLKRFSLYIHRDIDSNPLFEFLARHNHLKTLLLDTQLNHYSDFVHGIDNSCMELEELTLRNFCRYTSPFDSSKLQNLTKLRMLDADIGSDSYSVLPSLLLVIKSLEIVKLRSVELDVILRSLPQLENLRELHLINCSRFPWTWTMLSQLTKLHLINCRGSYCITVMLDELPNLEELFFNKDRIERIEIGDFVRQF